MQATRISSQLQVRRAVPTESRPTFVLKPLLERAAAPALVVRTLLCTFSRDPAHNRVLYAAGDATQRLSLGVPLAIGIDLTFEAMDAAELAASSSGPTADSSTVAPRSTSPSLGQSTAARPHA